MIIKDIAEILYYICFIFVAICWQRRATYMKRLEERGNLLEKLAEIMSIFEILKQDIAFLLSPIILYMDTDEEFKIRDERYKKIKEKINNSILLFQKFEVIYLNYFIKDSDIDELVFRLKEEIERYNLNVNAFILCNENTGTDISLEESSIIYDKLKNDERIFNILQEGTINNSNLILNKFEENLNAISNVIEKIKLKLVNLKFK